MISFGHVGAMRRAGMGGADEGDTYRLGVEWCTVGDGGCMQRREYRGWLGLDGQGVVLVGGFGRTLDG